MSTFGVSPLGFYEFFAQAQGTLPGGARKARRDGPKLWLRKRKVTLAPKGAQELSSRPRELLEIGTKLECQVEPLGLAVPLTKRELAKVARFRGLSVESFLHQLKRDWAGAAEVAMDGLDKDASLDGDSITSLLAATRAQAQKQHHGVEEVLQHYNLKNLTQDILFESLVEDDLKAILPPGQVLPLNSFSTEELVFANRLLHLFVEQETNHGLLDNTFSLDLEESSICSRCAARALMTVRALSGTAEIAARKIFFQQLDTRFTSVAKLFHAHLTASGEVAGLQVNDLVRLQELITFFRSYSEDADANLCIDLLVNGFLRDTGEERCRKLFYRVANEETQFWPLFAVLDEICNDFQLGVGVRSLEHSQIEVARAKAELMQRIFRQLAKGLGRFCYQSRSDVDFMIQQRLRRQPQAMKLEQVAEMRSSICTDLLKVQLLSPADIRMAYFDRNCADLVQRLEISLTDQKVQPGLAFPQELGDTLAQVVTEAVNLFSIPNRPLLVDPPRETLVSSEILEPAKKNYYEFLKLCRDHSDIEVLKQVTWLTSNDLSEKMAEQSNIHFVPGQTGSGRSQQVRDRSLQGELRIFTFYDHTCPENAEERFLDEYYSRAEAFTDTTELEGYTVAELFLSREVMREVLKFDGQDAAVESSSAATSATDSSDESFSSDDELSVADEKVYKSKVVQEMARVTNADPAMILALSKLLNQTVGNSVRAIYYDNSSIPLRNGKLVFPHSDLGIENDRFFWQRFDVCSGGEGRVMVDYDYKMPVIRLVGNDSSEIEVAQKEDRSNYCLFRCHLELTKNESGGVEISVLAPSMMTFLSFAIEDK